MMAPRKMIGAVFILATLTAVSILLLQWREPTYEGKALSTWLDEWEKSFGPPGTPYRPEIATKATQVESAIRKMGSDAVPSLRRMLRTHDTHLRQKVVAYCIKRPWIPLHFRPPAYRVHIRGMFGIRALGPGGKRAVPELLVLLNDPEWTVRGWAVGTLGRIGQEAKVAIPALTARLCDIDEHVRQAVCDALPELGATKEVVLPTLMRCLRDTNDGVFSAAVRTASRMGVESSALVPALTEQLGQNDSRVRYEAAMALGRCGGVARSAVPQLLKSVQDSDKDVREAAAAALTKIDPETAARPSAPPPPAPDTGEGSGGIALQGPASIALDIYKSIARVDLILKVQGPIPGLINVRATRPLSQKEAMEFLEKALLDQCGIVLEHVDEKHVIVKMRGDNR